MFDTDATAGDVQAAVIYCDYKVPRRLLKWPNGMTSEEIEAAIANLARPAPGPGITVI